MINRRYRNAIKYVKTLPGADAGSDHNPVVGQIKLKLKTVKKKQKRAVIDLRRVNDERIRARVTEELARKTKSTSGNGNIEEVWQQVKGIVNEASEKHLTAEKWQHKVWMTDEILELMEERRLWKNVDDTRYKVLHKQIQRKIRQAKQMREEELCREIEMLDSRHDTFNLHKKIKEKISTLRGKRVTTIYDRNGNAVLNIVEKKKLWETYIEELFHDVRDDRHGYENVESGPEILCEEVQYAIKQLHNGKAAGPDNVYGEVLMLLDDGGVKLLTKLFNMVYASGEIPKEWLKSYFIALPKKTNAKECADFRTISLMSHVLKVYLKVILRRIYIQCDEHISAEQFGFRKGLRTRDALFGLQVLVQRSLDMNKDVYACFIDFEKAFDKVQHGKMLKALQDAGIEGSNIRAIASLYWQQVASVLIDSEETIEINIKRGVRQGCVLSPTLFNLYSERIMTEALNEAAEGIVINGQLINNLRYADDTVLIASTAGELQVLLDRINRVSLQYGIKINERKTKYMVISKQDRVSDNLSLNGEAVERCHHFKYLGCLVNERWEMAQEINSRIEQARGVFTRMKKVFSDRTLSLKLRLKMIQCYVFPIVLYGMEGWTLTQRLEEKINAFEMWIYRRILKISWRDHVTNKDVLKRMNTERNLLYTVKERKLMYFGHVMRNEKYRLLHLIIQGRIEGRRTPGRRRTSWLANLRKWFRKSTSSLFRAAASKIRIAMMITNLQR